MVEAVSIDRLFISGLLLLGAAICARQLLAKNQREAENPFIFDRESDAVHLVMNAGMAIMLMAPIMQVHTLVEILYCLTVLVLVFRILLVLVPKSPVGTGPGRSFGGTFYHLMALLAMIYAGFSMQHEISPHGAHQMSHTMPMGESTTALDWKLQALGLLFLLDAILYSGVVLLSPKSVINAVAAKQSKGRGGQSGTNAEVHMSISTRQLWFGVAPHIIMDIGMVYMLLM